MFVHHHCHNYWSPSCPVVIGRPDHQSRDSLSYDGAATQHETMEWCNVKRPPPFAVAVALVINKVVVVVVVVGFLA